MAKSGSVWKLLLYGILTLLLLFGSMRILLGLGGKVFLLELLGVVVLVILSFVGLVSYSKPLGKGVWFVVFWCYIVNLLLLWYFVGGISVTLLLLALVGFLISLPGREAVLAAVSGEPHSMVFDSPPVGKEVAAEEKKPEVKFTPGKYVASKSSNTYHEPKCDWAKKIYPARRIWFNTSGEAKEKGYKAHSCVQ